MKNSRILNYCLVSGMILSSLSVTAHATEQVECGMPFDVYETTSNPVPEGVVYEYITDENGNFVLVEESASTTAPSTDSGNTENSEGGFDLYLTDKDGNSVLMEESASTTTPSTDSGNTENSEGGFDLYLTDKDGNSVLMEESASSDGTTGTDTGNWFTQFFSSIVSFLFGK